MLVSSDGVHLGLVPAGQRSCGVGGRRALAGGIQQRWHLVWHWHPWTALSLEGLIHAYSSIATAINHIHIYAKNARPNFQASIRNWSAAIPRDEREPTCRQAK